MTYEEYFNQKLDREAAQRSASDYDFRFSVAEKALDLRAMAFDFENHGLDEKLSQSVHTRATVGCSACPALVFPEEIIAGLHIGCGGTIQSLPF